MQLAKKAEIVAIMPVSNFGAPRPAPVVLAAEVVAEELYGVAVASVDLLVVAVKEPRSRSEYRKLYSEKLNEVKLNEE